MINIILIANLSIKQKRDRKKHYYHKILISWLFKKLLNPHQGEV